MMMLLTLAALAGAAQAQPAPVPAAAPNYAADATWLCLPGRTDPCAGALDTVELRPGGYGATNASRPAANPRADCFYVYPTVSQEPTMNSDMVPGPAEQGATRSQAARFNDVCRVYAPMYRQVTGMGLATSLSGGDIRGPIELAYQDVRAAFREFRRRSRGRPFLLVGHSQGSIHLLRLLQEEIEGSRTEARDMVAAYLIGWNVLVPEGQAVGGSLRSTPLCTRAGQTGCVVSYMSFRETAPPQAGGLFGRGDTPGLGTPVVPGMTAACVNPATLSPGPALMDSIWSSAFTTAGGSPAVEWSSQGPPSAPFVRTYGLVTARCVNQGAAGYLAVRVNADPADPRTDRIPGDIALMGQAAPSWGLHPVDMSIGMGDLIRLARTQIAAFPRR